MSGWGLVSKIGLFLIQYATMTAIGRRRAARHDGQRSRFLILVRPAPSADARPGSAGVRQRMPVAWNTALATAALTPVLPSSPTPLMPSGFTCSVVLRQQDGLDAADVGIDRHVVAGEVAR